MRLNESNGFRVVCRNKNQRLSNKALADFLQEQTLALQQSKLGPNHPDTLNRMWGIAELLVKLDRGAEAVQMADEGIRRMNGNVVEPSFTGLMYLRMRHFENLRDAAGCRQTAEMWEK